MSFPVSKKRETLLLNFKTSNFGKFKVDNQVIFNKKEKACSIFIHSQRACEVTVQFFAIFRSSYNIYCQRWDYSSIVNAASVAVLLLQVAILSEYRTHVNCQSEFRLLNEAYVSGHDGPSFLAYVSGLTLILPRALGN